MTIRLSKGYYTQVTEQVTEQVEALIWVLDKEMDRQEIQQQLGLSHRENFRSTYLKPALEQGLVVMTIPDKPNSRLQRYRLTKTGIALRESLMHKKELE